MSRNKAVKTLLILCACSMLCACSASTKGQAEPADGSEREDISTIESAADIADNTSSAAEQITAAASTAETSRPESNTAECASTSEANQGGTEQIPVKNLLDPYFDARNSDFYNTGILADWREDPPSDGAEVTSSKMRSCLIAMMAEKWDMQIESSETNYSIGDVDLDGNIAFVKVYEWIDVKYKYTVGSRGTDTLGYGVDHNMKLEKSGGEYSLISDTYDEGPLTGMSSSMTYDELQKFINATQP